MMPKSRRTRTGCLCCRRRHKKCDEQKPSCHFCITKGLQCEWPKVGVVFVTYGNNEQPQESQLTVNPVPFNARTFSTGHHSKASSVTDSSPKTQPIALSISSSSSYQLPPRLPHLELPPSYHYNYTHNTQTLPPMKQCYFTPRSNSTTLQLPNLAEKRLSVDSMLN